MTGYSTPGVITLALVLVQPGVLGTSACRCFAGAACPLTVLTNKGQYTQTFQERKSGLQGGDLPCGFFKHGRALFLCSFVGQLAYQLTVTQPHCSPSPYYDYLMIA